MATDFRSSVNQQRREGANQHPHGYRFAARRPPPHLETTDRAIEEQPYPGQPIIVAPDLEHHQRKRHRDQASEQVGPPARVSNDLLPLEKAISRIRIGAIDHRVRLRAQLLRGVADVVPEGRPGACTLNPTGSLRPAIGVHSKPRDARRRIVGELGPQPERNIDHDACPRFAEGEDGMIVANRQPTHAAPRCQ